MNSKVLLNQAPKDPTKLSHLAAIGLVIAALLFGGIAYKKWKVEPASEVNQPAVFAQQLLILGQSDVINTNWLRTLDPFVKNVEGKVVWSNTLQKGVMEFKGLPKLAEKQSYQLWIYDLNSDTTKPIFAKKFTDVDQDIFLIAFLVKQQIISPFKFEVSLHTEGEEINQPLFLAQP